MTFSHDSFTFLFALVKFSMSIVYNQYFKNYCTACKNIPVRRDRSPRIILCYNYIQTTQSKWNRIFSRKRKTDKKEWKKNLTNYQLCQVQFISKTQEIKLLFSLRLSSSVIVLNICFIIGQMGQPVSFIKIRIFIATITSGFTLIFAKFFKKLVVDTLEVVLQTLHLILWNQTLCSIVSEHER